MRRGSPEPISDVLKSVVEQISQTKKQDIHKIIAAWPALAGKKLAQHTRPAQLHKGTLLVNAVESAWLYQANFCKGKLLAAVQKKIGKDKVQNMRFRIGKVE